jgi:hypothetical protein
MFHFSGGQREKIIDVGFSAWFCLGLFGLPGGGYGPKSDDRDLDRNLGRPGLLPGRWRFGQ